MKKIRLFLVFIFLLSSGLTILQVNAQENQKEAKENEQKIQQQIEEQKKAMTEQKKAVTEQKKAISEQEKAQDEADQEIDEDQSQLDEDLKDIRVEVEANDDGRGGVTIYKRGGRKYRIEEPFGIKEFTVPGVEGFFGHNPGSDNESTTWDFSKSMKENTFSRDYSFDVEKSVNSVVMSVMGDCKAGEIRIKIVMPNGKTYSDIVIDEFGNLNWRKSFAISEEENQDKAGEWKFKIDASKASGFFKISLRTY
jgi:hypothetical protein